MNIAFLEDKPFFPVSPLQGESSSEETNWSSSSVPSDLFELLSEPILSFHDTILPTKQVPWITYYRKNLRKEMVPSTASLAPVHESEPTQA